MGLGEDIEGSRIYEAMARSVLRGWSSLFGRGGAGRLVSGKRVERGLSLSFETVSLAMF
jgi:hypothetical protein